MRSATRPLCLLMLILPLAAHAELVAVSSRSSGTTAPNPVILEQFGLDYWHYDGPDPAYALTLRSVFDTDRVFDGGGGQLTMFGADIAMTLEIDGHSYTYTGRGSARVQAYEYGGYTHEVSFTPPESSSYTVWVSNTLTGPGAPVIDKALAPFSVTLGPEMTALTDFSTLPNNPDAPGYWTQSGQAAAMALQISPVPETAPLAMALGGLAVLGLWRRRAPTAMKPFA